MKTRLGGQRRVSVSQRNDPSLVEKEGGGEGQLETAKALLEGIFRLMRSFRHMSDRCGAKNRRGEPCAARWEPGKKRCRFHGGRSTGPRTPGGRARNAAAQRRRW